MLKVCDSKVKSNEKQLPESEQDGVQTGKHSIKSRVHNKEQQTRHWNE